MICNWKTELRAVALICLGILIAACASVPPVPKADLPVLIDPRSGYEGPDSDRVDRKLEAAWQKLASGEIDNADKALTKLATKYPRYAPATLGRAAVALAKGQLDLAERFVEKATDPLSSYFAAEAYRSEIALERGLTEDAYRNYKRISTLPGAPLIVMTRLENVSDAWFDELIARARVAESVSDRIELLSEAVGVRPRSDSTRIALAKSLVAAEDWTRARSEVEALLDRGLVDDPDVQAVIADLEASDGRYQDAIVRLERLTRRYPDRGYEQRLAEVKLDYMRANLPPRYHRALAAPAISRADLAVLLYWHISAVRFANVSEPPIAVDISGAAGRDEIVKALGLGLLSVDPATRAVGPDTSVTSRAFLHVVGRLMRLGSLPACAGEKTGLDVLGACGIDLTAFIQNPSEVVSGRSAVAVFDAIDDLLASAEE